MAITSAKQQNMAKTNIGNNICTKSLNKSVQNKIAGQSNTVTPLGAGNA